MGKQKCTPESCYIAVLTKLRADPKNDRTMQNACRLAQTLGRDFGSDLQDLRKGKEPGEILRPPENFAFRHVGLGQILSDGRIVIRRVIAVSEDEYRDLTRDHRGW